MRLPFALVLGLMACACDPGPADLTDGGADDAATSPSCPSVAPANGGACDTTRPCHYIQCSDEGVVRATCDAGTWNVQTEPCAEIACGDTSCLAGEVCVSRIGGAVIYMCVEAPAGPLGCSSFCGSAGCNYSGLGGVMNDHPRSYVCEGCPSGTCA